MTVQNCSPYQNNLWKSSPDGHVGFEEQTGEFVNDVSSYLTMQYGAILEVVRERFSLVFRGLFSNTMDYSLRIMNYSLRIGMFTPL